MAVSEEQVIKGFLEVIKQISTASSKQVMDSAKKWSDTLRKFTENLSADFRSQLSSAEGEIKELRDTKMDASEKEELKQQIEAFKDQMLKSFKENVANLANSNQNAFNFLTAKLETMLSKTDPDTVAKEVEAALDEKIQAQMQEMREENKRAIDSNREKFDGLSKSVVSSVTGLIHNTISPANIQGLIATLPEYEALKNGNNANVAQVSDPQRQSIPNFDAIKESIASLTYELVELKQSSQQTKAVVDTMRSQILPRVTNPAEFDHQVAVKRMEEMERNVTVIHNNIKMIETIVKVKAAESGDSSNINSSNKRARIDIDGNSINHDQYMAAIAEVELKHQKLVDFIVQCRDTVLDEEFQNRLEAVVAKIEQVLL